MDKIQTYTCEKCKETFEEGWSKEEALQEMTNEFGHIPEDKRAILCDDCYNDLQAHFKNGKFLIDFIKDVPNFPKEGVFFKDIMPLFLEPEFLKKLIVNLAKEFESYKPTHIVGIESRGFLLAVPLAYELGVKFIPARKKGKLPGEVISQSYELEYGIDTIEIQKDALDSDGRYLIVDDVLATGGTALAVNELLHSRNLNVVCNLFLIELKSLNGRKKLLSGSPPLDIQSCLIC